MFTATIVLLLQCVEENRGTQASQRSFGLLDTLPTRQIVENSLAHMLNNAVNLAVRGW
jgi:hypothetical protein